MLSGGSGLGTGQRMRVGRRVCELAMIACTSLMVAVCSVLQQSESERWHNHTGGGCSLRSVMWVIGIMHGPAFVVIAVAIGVRLCFSCF